MYFTAVDIVFITRFLKSFFGKIKLVYTALNFVFSFAFSAELSDIREEMMLAAHCRAR